MARAHQRASLLSARSLSLARKAKPLTGVPKRFAWKLPTDLTTGLARTLPKGLPLVFTREPPTGILAKLLKKPLASHCALGAGEKAQKLGDVPPVPSTDTAEHCAVRQKNIL